MLIASLIHTDCLFEDYSVLTTRLLLAAVSIYAVWFLIQLAGFRCPITTARARQLLSGPTIGFALSWAIIFAILNIWVMLDYCTPPGSAAFHSFYSVSLIATLGGIIAIIQGFFNKIRYCKSSKTKPSVEESDNEE